MPPATEAHDPVRALAALELVAVGTHVALFRPDNHAVALLNAAAASLCRAPAADACAGAPEAQEFLAGLRAAGFLDAPLEARSVIDAAPAAEVDQRACPVLGVYGMGHGPRVRLAVVEPSLARLLKAALRPLAVGPEASWETEISVAPTPGGFCIRRETSVIGHDLAPSDARRIALQAMLTALHPAGTIAAILHASTVCLAGQAVVLAGASGSGKSTLAMALAGDGAGWLADDFTPLDRTGRTATAFPVAASVKSGSWPLLAGRFPELMDCPVHVVGERRVRYLVPERSAFSTVVPDRVQIGALVFPQFVAQAPVQSERLSPEAALTRLLASGAEAVGWPRSLGAMAGLVNGVPAWGLSYGDLDAGAAAVRALAAQGGCERIAS